MELAGILEFMNVAWNAIEICLNNLEIVKGYEQC